MRVGILSAELGREDIHENNRLVREIRLKGHRPVIINYSKTVLAMRGRQRLLYQPDKDGQLRQIRVDAVIPRINEADEQSINLATLALHTLLANGAVSTASPGGIRLAKNKISSLVALTEAGVPVPRSAAITGTETYAVDIDRVLKIVEPNQTKRIIVKTSTGTHGMGVMSANSRGDARAIVDAFLANNLPVLVQQFIEPTKKDTYVDLRLIIVGGQVVGAMKRISAKKDEIRANLSLGGTGEPYTPTDYECEIAKKAAKSVGLSVAGVDIIPSGRSRLVIEVNASPGFIIEDITKNNIPKKIVQLAITGARRGQRTAAQRLSDALNTKIEVSKLSPVPVSKRTTKKIIKLLPRVQSKQKSNKY